MIFVGGLPFNNSSSPPPPPPSSSESQTICWFSRFRFRFGLCFCEQPSDLLAALMKHPILVAATRSFKSIQEKRVSESDGSESTTSSSNSPRYVYLFQREYATVDPSLVHYVGTDEATTCVGVVIRNRRNGMTSVAHMDSPKVVDTGFSQMLELVVDHNLDADLDVHLVGGYEDVSPTHARGRSISEGKKADGHSIPLCRKIVQTMQKRLEKFHLQTLCVLGHNTKYDSQGNAYPVFNGFLVEPSSGSLIPACFDRTSRCPDETVRRLRVCASYQDQSWTGKLLDTYDTKTDRFGIAPCSWTRRLVDIVSSLQSLTDSEILTSCSTSPLAEGPDFVDNERRLWDYMVNNPDWRKTFPMRQTRVFERTDGGGWKWTGFLRKDKEHAMDKEHTIPIQLQ